jgi:hypothetical protein
LNNDKQLNINKMNEGIKMKGQIEVILEDRYGKVKQREISDNTITDAYLKYLLLQGMSPFAATSRVSAGNLVSAAVPSSFGIYVMSEPIVVNRDTYLPPYVDNARNGLLPAVAFYNVDGATTETPQVMIRKTRTAFSTAQSWNILWSMLKRRIPAQFVRLR